MKKNFYFLIIILTAIALTLLILIKSKKIGGQNSQSNQKQVSQTPQIKESFRITILDSSFSPNNAFVPRGKEITFLNTDKAIHRIKGENFDSGNLSSGESFNFKFENSGTYEYTCSVHPNVKGKITVK